MIQIQQNYNKKNKYLNNPQQTKQQYKMISRMIHKFRHYPVMVPYNFSKNLKKKIRKQLEHQPKITSINIKQQQNIKYKSLVQKYQISSYVVLGTAFFFQTFSLFFYSMPFTNFYYYGFMVSEKFNTLSVLAHLTITQNKLKMYFLLTGLLITNILPMNYLLSFSIQAMQMLCILLDDGNKFDGNLQYSEQEIKTIKMRTKSKAILFFFIALSSSLKFWYHISDYIMQNKFFQYNKKNKQIAQQDPK